ncbi:MAG: DUF4411 family protein, partial [Candidatus Cloacimonadaceae bacterium]|nr:DUF4411 family protein [Candidatus Cloacimonadaceae bacterium]
CPNWQLLTQTRRQSKFIKIEFFPGSRTYPRAAKDKIADISDSWLIAYAKASEAILVTNENKKNRTSIIPIPAVCRQFGVEYMNTFEMLRRLNIKLS